MTSPPEELQFIHWLTGEIRKRGLTKREFSALIGTPWDFIDKHQYGSENLNRGLGPEIIQAIADALNVSFEVVWEKIKADIPQNRE